LHFDVGEEFLACVLQAGSENVDQVVNDQETIVVALAVIESDRRVLLVMSLYVELQLAHVLRLLMSVYRGGNT